MYLLYMQQIHNFFFWICRFRAAPENNLAPTAPAGGEAGEDGIVGGPRTPQQIAAQKRLQQTQAQVDEVCEDDGNDGKEFFDDF